MSLIIFNADDFGYSRGVNLGIIDAHAYGILTSTTLLANLPAFDDAIALTRQHPTLAVGVHLNLTMGAPLSSPKDVPSLVTREGVFHTVSTYYDKHHILCAQELYREWRAQIEKVINAGIKPSHIDSHHHINTLPLHQEVFLHLAQEYHLPVRRNMLLPPNITTTNYFYTEFDQLSAQKELNLKNLIALSQEHQSIEVMCHPSYIDLPLIPELDFSLNRVSTVAELQNPRYKELLKHHQVKLGTFFDLHKTT